MTKKDLIKQVEQLKKDLRTVCTNPNSMEGITIKFREQMEADTEKAYFMYCYQPSETPTRFTGLKDAISGGVKDVYYAQKSDLTEIKDNSKGFEISIDMSKENYWPEIYDEIEIGESVMIALFKDVYRKLENGEWVKI
jgi:hypothetical protein